MCGAWPEFIFWLGRMRLLQLQCRMGHALIFRNIFAKKINCHHSIFQNTLWRYIVFFLLWTPSFSVFFLTFCVKYQIVLLYVSIPDFFVVFYLHFSHFAVVWHGVGCSLCLHICMAKSYHDVNVIQQQGTGVRIFYTANAHFRLRVCPSFKLMFFKSIFGSDRYGSYSFWSRNFRPAEIAEAWQTYSVRAQSCEQLGSGTEFGVKSRLLERLDHLTLI